MKCKQNTYHPLPPTTHCPPQHTVNREAVRWVWSSSPSTVSGHLGHLLTPSLIPKLRVVWGIQGFGGTPPLQGSPHCSCTFLDNYYNRKGFFVFTLAPTNAGFIREQLIYSINIFTGRMVSNGVGPHQDNPKQHTVCRQEKFLLSLRDSRMLCKTLKILESRMVFIDSTE